MPRRHLRTVFAAALLTLGAVLETCSASSPPYLILQNKPADNAVKPAPAQRYSYGWFGAAPRKHWNRHFGYHRQYIQWSRK